MEGQQRKRYTSEEKVAILKEHLDGRKSVSEVCERHGIAVIMFCRWQEEFFAKAVGGFDSPRPHPARDAKLEKRVVDLESRLTTTRSASTARSATSPRQTSWPAGKN